jgi:hypothetical protein
VLNAPPVPKAIRDEIISRSESIDEILTGPFFSGTCWARTHRMKYLQPGLHRLREMAQRNGGLAHVSGVFKSFFCATTPEGRVFLHMVLELLQK